MTTDFAKAGGRVIPKPVADLIALHAFALQRGYSLTDTDWVEDMELIARALGFTPGSEGRLRAAALVADSAPVLS